MSMMSKSMIEKVNWVSFNDQWEEPCETYEICTYHIGISRPSYLCTQCDYKVSKKYLLRLHIKDKHIIVNTQLRFYQLMQ